MGIRRGTGWTAYGKFGAALLVSGLLLLIATASASALPASFYGVDAAGGQLQNEEDATAIQRSGAKYVRINFNWGVRRASGWESLDREVEGAWKKGVPVLADLYGGGTLGPNENRQPAEAEWSEWETFVYEVVQRYGYGGSFWAGKSAPLPVNTWEVWNEENMPLNSPTGTAADPVSYAKFLKRTANALRAAQGATPITVLMGGLVTATTGSGRIAVQKFIKEVAEAGVSELGSTFNGIGLHPYAFGSKVSTVVAQVEENITAARSALTESFSATKTIAITELGWPINGDTEHPSVSPTLQAELVAASFKAIEAMAATDNISSLFYYFYRDNGAPGWAYSTGLRAANGWYRPAWVSYQAKTGAAPYPEPAAVTNIATGVKETEATLNGIVNPNSRETTYWFEYGPTSSYGTSTATTAIGSGEAPLTESKALTGLNKRQLYHFRIVAHNSAGYSYGEDQTFATGLLWHLRNANTGGLQEVSFWFGLPGETKLSGDWNGDGKDTAGVYDPATGNWKFRNSNTTGGADISLSWGGPAWTPVVGDWDGNGTDTPGEFNQSTGEWRFKNTFSGSGWDIEMKSWGGLTGSTPIAGDWNGDGKDSPGLYNPTTGQWIMKDTFTGSGWDHELKSWGGESGGIPVTGDWNGDGKSTPGLYNGSTGVWLLKNTFEGSGWDVEVQFGGYPWTAVPGDWDGNGTSTIGATDPQAQNEMIWNGRNSNTKGSPEFSYEFGIPGEAKLAGDWDGDGKDSAAVFNSVTGNWQFRNNTAVGSGVTELKSWGGLTGSTPIVGDWDGNGTDTPGLYNPKSGQWLLKDTFSGSGWDHELKSWGGESGGIPIIGDWNGDGKDSPGLYNPKTGQWIMKDTLSGSGWDHELKSWGGESGGIPVTGDWNGDGKTTIGLYNASTGVWLLKNTFEGSGWDLEPQYGGYPATAVPGDWDGNGSTTIGLSYPY